MSKDDDEKKSPYLQMQTKPRKCLRCGKVFQSTGPGNRICSSTCKGTQGIKTTKVSIAHKQTPE